MFAAQCVYSIKIFSVQTFPEVKSNFCLETTIYMRFWRGAGFEKGQTSQSKALTIMTHLEMLHGVQNEIWDSCSGQTFTTRRII